MMRFFSLTLVSSLALAGCMAGPDHAPPPPPASHALQSGAFLRAGDADTARPVARWWEGLGDAQLTGLIDQGLKDAPGIAAAQARVRQARAGLVRARADLLPTLGSSAMYLHADLPNDAFGTGPGKNDLYSLGFDAQWEIDLWGGKRRATERSRAQAEAAEARLADAQVSLSAEIARNYIALRAREASLALLDRRHALESRIAAASQRRYDGGTAPRLPVEAALQQVQRTEAERAAMAAEITVLRDSLAVLTGQAPGMLDSLARAEIPLPPAAVTVGDPAAMLARRPDIRAAERQLAAANAQIGVEAARRFPSLSLTGLIGIGGTSAGDMFDTSQLAAIALPRLNWSFLDFGRVAAAKRGAVAGRDAALADYRASVLAALQDAEGALARYGAARTGLARAGGVARHADQIARLQGLRAEAGTGSSIDAMEAERRSVDARIAEANSRADLTLTYVALAKALGLGWKADTHRQ